MLRTSHLRWIAGTAPLLFVAGLALADWNPRDDHKMHFPQLPNPNGYDVNMTDGQVGDDWQCSETGTVDDIHIWVSWYQDLVAPVISLNVQIWSNQPADPIEQLPSRPRDLLWERDFVDADLIRGPTGTGLQSFYDPHIVPERIYADDHDLFEQINIVNIPDPFLQKRGEIYWLVLKADVDRSNPAWEFSTLGWKTSTDRFMDDSVARLGPGVAWRELRDPREPSLSLDQAFVITPEPATLGLLAVGGLMMLRHR